jgi:hypothetical protein
MLMPARRVVIAHNEDKREQTVSEVRGHVCIFMSLPAAGNTRNYSERALALASLTARAFVHSLPPLDGDGF